jgi:hypothetical protein
MLMMVPARSASYHIARDVRTNSQDKCLRVRVRSNPIQPLPDVSRRLLKSIVGVISILRDAPDKVHDPWLNRSDDSFIIAWQGTQRKPRDVRGCEPSLTRLAADTT